jgi:hypothetical protein
VSYKDLRIDDVIPLYGRFYRISHLGADDPETMAIEVTRLPDADLPPELPPKIGFLTAPLRGWLVIHDYRIHVARIRDGDAKTAMPGPRAALEIGLDGRPFGEKPRIDVRAGDLVKVADEQFRVVRVVSPEIRTRLIQDPKRGKVHVKMTGWVEFEPVKPPLGVKAGTDKK